MGSGRSRASNLGVSNTLTADAWRNRPEVEVTPIVDEADLRAMFSSERKVVDEALESAPDNGAISKKAYDELIRTGTSIVGIVPVTSKAKTDMLGGEITDLKTLEKRFNVREGTVGVVCETVAKTTLRLNKVAQKLGVEVPNAINFGKDEVAQLLDKRAFVAASYSPKTKSIYPGDSSNTYNWNIDLVIKSQNRGFENNYSLGSTPVASIVHEYGHHIENVVFRHNAQVGSGRRKLTAVSTYGNVNNHEAFAEAFTMYCYDAKPQQGKVYYANFKKLMKDNGLESFKGCMKE